MTSENTLKPAPDLTKRQMAVIDRVAAEQARDEREQETVTSIADCAGRDLADVAQVLAGKLDGEARMYVLTLVEQIARAAFERGKVTGRAGLQP